MSLDNELLERLEAAAAQNPGTAIPESEKALAELASNKQQLLVDQSRAYLEELFRENASAPVRIKNVQVTNGQSFREGFLQAQLSPLLGKPIMPLSAFFKGLERAHANLRQHDVLEAVVIGLHQLPRRGRLGFPSGVSGAGGASGAIDLVPVFNIVPQKRFFAKTGTNVGNGEGDGYIQLQAKNLFGGAESLVFDAVTGTRTPSSYLVSYSQPVAGSAQLLWATLAYMNTRRLDWIHGSVATRGLTTRLTTRMLEKAVNFDVAGEVQWRGLANHASLSVAVMAQLGDSFRSSVLVGARYDTRNNAAAPSSGTLLRCGVEVASSMPAGQVGQVGQVGQMPLTKVAVEAQHARLFADTHTVVATGKAGAIVSGAAGVLDRFYVGGPNDVRSFALNGIGPKDQNSCVGGDYFANGGVSVLSHIARTPRDSGFRWHNYVNFGKLVAATPGVSGVDIARNFVSGFSVSLGTGVVYTHPQARFELNFGLPVAVHANDFMKKGLQYGVGVSFL